MRIQKNGSLATATVSPHLPRPKPLSCTIFTLWWRLTSSISSSGFCWISRTSRSQAGWRSRCSFWWARGLTTVYHIVSRRPSTSFDRSSSSWSDFVPPTPCSNHPNQFSRPLCTLGGFSGLFWAEIAILDDQLEYLRAFSDAFTPLVVDIQRTRAESSGYRRHLKCFKRT